MKEKLQKIIEAYDELQAKMGDPAVLADQKAVSYTHLDVYKRQVIDRVGVHRAHGVERQAAFAHHLGAGGDVALARCV